MSTAARFRAFFQLTTLSISALSACGGSVVKDQAKLREGGTPSAQDAAGPGGTPDTGTTTTEVCDGKTWLPAPSVVLADAEYFELRYYDFAAGVVATSSTGTPCLGAASQDCANALASLEAQVDDALSRNSYTNLVSFGRRLAAIPIVTRGETPAMLTAMDLKAALAPISSFASAALLVALDGYDVLCPQTGGGPAGDGFIVRVGGCYGGAGGTPSEGLALVRPDGSLSAATGSSLPNVWSACAGRRHEHFVPGARDEAQLCALGAHFARLCELEAAAVVAFERLAAELSDAGAPADLVLRAAEAAVDEVRHTQAMRRLALRFGADVKVPEPVPMAIRPLDAVALENAAEGCIRETFGALVATYQAQHADDAEVREVMRVVAEEETRHAALSWDIARWAEGRLSQDSRETIRRERERAMDALAGQLSVTSGDQETDTRRALGLPLPGESASLFQAFARLVHETEGVVLATAP